MRSCTGGRRVGVTWSIQGSDTFTQYIASQQQDSLREREISGCSVRLKGVDGKLRR